MNGKIFINYRRGDDPGNTGRLFDRLQEAFKAEQLFIDVDNIPPGHDFVQELEKQIAQCDVLLAVIGKGWLDSRDEKGIRRIDRPHDFVRIEIESALKQNKLVIPVLVHEAHMPHPDELPEAIRPLARRNAVRLTHERFKSDTQGLIKAIRAQLDENAALRQAKIEIAERSEPAAEQEAAPQPEPAAPKADRLGVISASRSPWRSISTLLFVGAIFVFGALVWFSASRSPDFVSPQASSPAVENRPRGESPAVSSVREQPLKANDIFKECVGCPEMIVVPAGSFTMGSPANELGRTAAEGPQHHVKLSNQFAVGRFSLSFEEWDTCVTEGGCKGYRPNAPWGGGRQPVINVSWDDAKSYSSWLSKKTGKNYRLLSEAEREYVTRAGTSTPFWWGTSISTSQANYNGVAYGKGARGELRGKTVPLESFQPNPWGLYQVHGNVWEWVEDCWNDNYLTASPDGSPITSPSCGRRVLRGGSWNFRPDDLRSAARNNNVEGIRLNVIGFRVARSLSP